MEAGLSWGGFLEEEVHQWPRRRRELGQVGKQDRSPIGAQKQGPDGNMTW